MSTPEPITHRAGRGATWMTGANVVVLLVSLVAQVILGWVLSDRDFGIYALALTVSIVFQVVKDGGIGLLLAKEKPENFQRLVSDAFWLGLAAALLMGGLVVGTAPLFGAIYDQSELTGLLIIIGLSLPLTTYSTACSASLQVNLRFETLAKVGTFSSILRQVLLVVFALAGLGPLSFVLPIPITAAIDVIVYGWVTRLRVARPSGWAGPLSILHQTKWALGGSIAEVTSMRSDYLALGLVIPVETLGIYFFAFELTDKLRVLFTGALRPVLMPSLARRADDRPRWNAGLLASLGLMTFIASAPAFFLAGSAGLLESVLWQGRWDAAVIPIALLSAVIPATLATGVLRTALQSLGRFKAWSAALAARAVSQAVVALAVGAAVGSRGAGWVAAGMVAYLVIFTAGEAVWIARRLDLAVPPVIAQSTLPGIAGLVGAAAAVAVGVATGPLAAEVRFLAAGVAFAIVFIVLGYQQLRTRLSGLIPYMAGIPVLNRFAALAAGSAAS